MFYNSEVFISQSYFLELLSLCWLSQESLECHFLFGKLFFTIRNNKIKTVLRKIVVNILFSRFTNTRLPIKSLIDFVDVPLDVFCFHNLGFKIILLCVFNPLMPGGNKKVIHT